IIDPVCSIAFESEPEDADLMRRPPRPTSAPLLSRRRIVWCLVQGATTFATIACLYVAALWYGLPADQARALAFGALIAGLVALVLANRSFDATLLTAFARPNPLLWGVFGLAALIFGVTLRWSPARQLFDFGAFHAHDILISVSIGLVPLLL